MSRSHDGRLVAGHVHYFAVLLLAVLASSGCGRDVEDVEAAVMQECPAGPERPVGLDDGFDEDVGAPVLDDVDLSLLASLEEFARAKPAVFGGKWVEYEGASPVVHVGLVDPDGGDVDRIRGLVPDADPGEPALEVHEVDHSVEYLEALSTDVIEYLQSESVEVHLMTVGVDHRENMVVIDGVPVSSEWLNALAQEFQDHAVCIRRK